MERDIKMILHECMKQYILVLVISEVEHSFVSHIQNKYMLINDNASCFFPQPDFFNSSKKNFLKEFLKGISYRNFHII